MKIAFVLGRLNSDYYDFFIKSNFDTVYYFWGECDAVLHGEGKFRRLDAVMLNAGREREVIDRCIFRVSSCLNYGGVDEEIMRRAIRLSDLRVEVRAYINMLSFLGKHKRMKAASELYIFSRYIVESDVETHEEFNMTWACFLHPRLSRFVPNRFLSLLVRSLCGRRR